MSQPHEWAIYILKKRQGPSLEKLKAKRRRIYDEEKKAKKEVKARGSFSEDFFSGASRAESLTLERLRVTSAIFFSEFQGEISTWANEETVREMFASMHAADYRARSFQERSEALEDDKKTPGGRFRALFMKLFTSARSGLDIKGVGEGHRNKQMQSDFRKKLMEDYDAVAKGGYIWCPVMQVWYRKDCMRASHIFSYKHGQDVMDEIFGKTRPSELFSSKNGLLIHKTIEDHFDKGYFVIVPDIAEMHSLDKVRTWLTGEVREYKIRIIDSAWKELDQGILDLDGLKWRDLDNRKLVFQNNTRPAARYLYFHYCLQILRRAWKISPVKTQISVGEAQAASLCEEFGQYLWATPGRYVGRKMLKALVDTLGGQYKELMRGASMNSSSPDSFMDALTVHIADSSSPDEDTDEESEGETETEDEMEVDEDYQAGLKNF